MSANPAAIEAARLRKHYRQTTALDGFDLSVPAGMVYGLLGPNGAGKTTAVRVLTTLTQVDSGRAAVAGYDVSTQARLVRQRIGLTGQQTAVDDVLTAKQNLTMFGRLFRLNKAAAQQRADELLAQFGLADVAGQSPKKFSGGMRRRLDLAASMILAPEVLFLDEPTTGLDPAGRGEVWEVVRELAAGGTTVLLTTHYLDEADQLCDRIGLIDHGTNVVEDSPAGLKRKIGNERLEIVATEADSLGALGELAARVSGTGQPTIDEASLAISVPVANGVQALTEMAGELQRHGTAVADIGLRRPTLDEAFLHLTGTNNVIAPTSNQTQRTDTEIRT